MRAEGWASWLFSALWINGFTNCMRRTRGERETQGHCQQENLLYGQSESNWQHSVILGILMTTYRGLQNCRPNLAHPWFINKLLLEYSYALIYIWPVAASVLHQQSWVFATETVQLTKPKIFTISLFTESLSACNPGPSDPTLLGREILLLQGIAHCCISN